MPSNDLVLNVRQIAGYPATGAAIATDSLLLQRGLGGAYLSISPAALVATALSNGGDMAIGGQLLAASLQSSKGQFSTLATGLFAAQKASVVELCASYGSVGGNPIATVDYVDGLVANGTVHSVNGRRGDIVLSVWDVPGAAPIFSPRFQGSPRALTPPPSSCSDRLATTAFVHRNTIGYIDHLLADHPFVFSFNGRTGDIVLTPEDIGNVEGALLNSPALQGTPTAPTAPPLTESDQLATTAYVDAAVGVALGQVGTMYAPISSPAFVGYATAPTPAPGTSNAQLATTAFVMNAVAESVSGVATWNGRTGNVTIELADITGAGGAPINSPVFTGTPQATTATAGDNSTRIATTAWVLNELGGSTIGVMSFNGRDGVVTLNTADITGAGGAPLASPALTGVPTAPTATAGTSTGQLATTAFVMNAINTQGVASFNGRTGAITLTANDVSAAGGLSNPSPALTGSPTAPTAAPGTATTQLATTAFVGAAITAAGGVTSFNGRSGAVTLTSGDINASSAGGPYATQAALANYLPLIGGTLTGTLNGTTAVFSGNVTGLALASQAAGAGNAVFNLQNNVGAVVGSLAWNQNTGVVAVTQTYSGGNVGIDNTGMFSASGTITSQIGYLIRAGVNGSTGGGNQYNFFYSASSLQAWLGTTNLGNVTLTSDYRIKKDVAALPSMWERVKALRPVRYTHRDFGGLVEGDDVERWGFVAHELQETLIDSAATGKKDAKNLIQSPDPWPVLATLTRALQEAMARIETLEARLA